MPGDEVCSEHGLAEWQEQFAALERRALRLQTVRDQLLVEHTGKVKEIEMLGEKVLQLTKVGELLRVLIDQLVLDQVRSIEAIVSEGFRSIFHDQDLAFESDVGTKYNRLAIDFFIRQGTDDNQVRGAPLESFGGGPSSIASLILRLLTLMRLKKRPLLLLDETLAAVSEEYLDNVGRFLHRLAITTGIDVLLVTHKPTLADHAHLAYQGVSEVQDDGVWDIKLRKLRGSST